MKRLSQLLDRQLHRSFSALSPEQQLMQNHVKDWSIQKQTLPLKSTWDIIQASVILQGVSNKIAIERAYIKIMDGMENYWQVLDYQERTRILNYDLQATYDSLPTFTHQSKQLIIPFFNECINFLYQNEMVKYDLKQYSRLSYDYREWIQSPSNYGLAMYDGSFVSAILVGQKDGNYVIYHPELMTFFVCKEGSVDYFPLFDAKSATFVLTPNQKKTLAFILLEEDVAAFLAYATENQLYHPTFIEAIQKKHRRKHFLF